LDVSDDKLLDRQRSVEDDRFQPLRAAQAAEDLMETRTDVGPQAPSGIEALLPAILDTVAQPVWVVDATGAISFANPAALEELGYPTLAALRGKPSHETIHYRHPDGSPFPVEECPMLRPRTTGETVSIEEDWFFRRDGTMFPVSYWSAPIDMPDGRGAVVAFTNIEERRRAEEDRLARLEAERDREVAHARADELAAARRRVIDAADQERRRVTRDLHDGAQQELLNVVLNLKRAQRLRSDKRQASASVDDALDAAERALESLRQLAAGMHPAILSHRGLAAALGALASRMPLPVQLAELPDGRMPEELEISLYFFVSEALTNVVKHAAATSATVRITAGDPLRVEVADDGVGGAEIDLSGSGLANLADRIAALDGELEVESPPGHGTRLVARVPIPS
jgi:PAS domain S-box-containing protein